MRSTLCIFILCALMHDPLFALDPPISVRPDSCITCQATSQLLCQAEPSVAIHPTNPNVLLVTTNTWADSTYSAVTTTASVSTDGGFDWTVYESPAGDDNGGDPVSGITPSGRFLSMYIREGQDGQDVAYSTDSGVNWTAVTAEEDVHL